MNSSRNKIKSFAILLLALFSSISWGQENGYSSPKTNPNPPYITTGAQGFLLSTAFRSRPGVGSALTTPRFTFLLNFGVNLNYDLSDHFGVYSGISVKNIGFIEKVDGFKYKRRDFTVGAPFGVKVGNIKYGDFFMFGGGVDFPFNYREKKFKHRGHKDKKFNEWFSDRTPTAMGYIFAGVHLHPGVALRLSYYPGNFLNPNFEEMVDGKMVKPYEGYKVHLLLLSAGFDIRYRPR